MARPAGVTKAKKAIRKQDFERLLDFVGKNKVMNHPTRQKLKAAYTLIMHLLIMQYFLKLFYKIKYKKILQK